MYKAETIGLKKRRKKKDCQVSKREERKKIVRNYPTKILKGSWSKVWLYARPSRIHLSMLLSNDEERLMPHQR
jgi:hypothetical protein